MKKLFFAIAMCVAFVGCKPTPPTPEETAQNLIKEYLLVNLNDPSKYEAVAFGELDTLKYLWATRKAEIERNIGFVEKRIEWANSDIKHYKRWRDMYSQSDIDSKNRDIRNCRREIDSLKIELTKQNEWVEFVGLQMTHNYRVDTPLGKMLWKCRFTFDTELTKIVSVEDLE